MSLSQKTDASRFTSISTLFAQPFARRTNWFNFPRSIECRPRSGSPPCTSQPHACCAEATHTHCNHHFRNAPHPAAAPTTARKWTHPCHHLKVHPPAASARFHRRHPNPRTIALFFAPTYGHISSNAIVDAAIITALPLARLALIRSRATSPLSDVVPRGLSEDIVRLISRKKGEPELAARVWRLRAYHQWLFVHRSEHVGKYIRARMLLKSGDNAYTRAIGKIKPAATAPALIFASGRNPRLALERR